MLTIEQLEQEYIEIGLDILESWGLDDRETERLQDAHLALAQEIQLRKDESKATTESRGCQPAQKE